jgi:hypothetical protein
MSGAMETEERRDLLVLLDQVVMSVGAGFFPHATPYLLPSSISSCQNKANLPLTVLICPCRPDWQLLLACQPLLSPKAIPAFQRVDGTARSATYADHSSNSPLLVASSKSGTSTALAGKCTYRTTEPRIKTFLTALWSDGITSQVSNHPVDKRSTMALCTHEYSPSGGI